MENNEGTTATAGEAPEVDETAPAGAAPQGTTGQVDEVTTLKSRNAGLDAKVTTLMQTLEAERKAREAAEARALELAQGKDNGDQELRAQLSRAEQLIAAAEKKARLADLRIKYPEATAELGDLAVDASEERLSALEARLVGLPAESNRPPVPVGNSAARPATGVKTIEEMSLAELKEYAAQQFGSLTFADLANQD